MTVFQEQEIEAFTWMQGRVVDLFLQHNTERFAKTFGEHDQTEERTEDSVLERYRNLAVLFYLKVELFEQILPGIKRRLSFEAPRITQVEELPARGRIDWQRTARESWDERPGEFPLEVHTRQRRRHFSTPENLLTVITILEYRAGVQELLDNEASINSLHALAHPLNDIVDLCTRELVFLQFAGLVRECEDIIGGYSSVTVDVLEGQVAENLLPGKNSAYSELLDWRQKFANLRLLSRSSSEELQNTLGADPKHDNYLYQLWLFYEMGDYLQRTGRLIKWNHKQPNMWLKFSWGEVGKEVQYRLQHDQGIKNLPKYWGGNAPGVRPDFYIERTDRKNIKYKEKDKEEIIWHEPGFMLDAKYYKPSDSEKAPSSPIKRMVADLQLTGERNGILLFAFHSGESTSEEKKSSAKTISPIKMIAQFMQPDIQVKTRNFKPKIGGYEHYLDQAFEKLLGDVHNALKVQIEIRCRGVFLDSLSTNAMGEMVSATLLQNRTGTVFEKAELEKLLLCPKPHVAPWRVDIVHLERDCLKSNLCHICGEIGVKKPQRIVKFEDIKEAIRSSTVGEDNEEAIIKVATQQVLKVTQRFAELIQPRLEDYHTRIKERLDLRDEFDKTPLLNDIQRNTLSLAYFLEEQIRRIGAENFAGPALLYTGVLEEITQKTIHKKRPTLYTTEGSRLGDTLGTIGNCKDFGGTNWPLLQKMIEGKGYWNEGFIPGQTHDFSKWVDLIKSIVPLRNTAAHKAFIDAAMFQQLVALYFGSPSTGYGAFSILLLAWRSTPLQGGIKTLL